MSKRERKRGCVCKRRGSAILVAAILVTAIYYNEVIDWKFQYSISVFLLLSYIRSTKKANQPHQDIKQFIMTTAAAGILLQHSHQLVYVFEIPNTLCTWSRNYAFSLLKWPPSLTSFFGVKWKVVKVWV